MKTYSSKLSLLCAVLISVCSVQAQSGQNISQNSRSVLNIQSVTRTQIVYDLKVIEAEFPLETLAANFREKSGILSCTVTPTGVTVVTEPEIDRTMVIGVVKASGFRNTYNTYKQELREAVPKPERRQESK